VDPWCTPTGILPAHLADQISDWGTSIPIRRVLVLHSLGRLAWQIHSRESHVEKTKEQQEDRYTGLAQP
jgi:hypothetical protein